MDQARMANSNSSQDNSDDLIAELARLMAQDAQGEAPQKNNSAAQEQASKDQDAPREDEPSQNPSFQNRRDETFSNSSDKLHPEPGLMSRSHQSAMGRAPTSRDPQKGASPETGVSNDNQWHATKVEPDRNQQAPSEDAQADDLFSQLAAQLKTIEPSVTADQHQDTPQDKRQEAPQDKRQEAPQETPIAAAHPDHSNAGDDRASGDMDRFGSGAATAQDVQDSSSWDEKSVWGETGQVPSAVDPIAHLIATDGDTETLAAEVEREANAAARAAAHHEADQDSFDVAPVMGLGGASKAPSAAQQSQTERAQKGDPISEIEALIGEAVRAGWKPDTAAQGQAEASVPPAQQVAPGGQQVGPGGMSARVEPAQDPVGDAAAAVEAAISAAAFSSKQNKWAPSSEAPTAVRGQAGPEPTPLRSEPELNIAEPTYDDIAPRRGVQRFGLPVAALAIVLLAGAGGYWYLTNQPAGDGEAPVLAANTDGAKVVPPAENTTSTGQQSVVFSELNKNGDTPPPNEQIVSRDQSASGAAGEVRQVGAGAATADASATAAGTTDTATGSGAALATQTQNNDAPMTLTNRKVRTVTVLPDGTIVSEDTAVAGNQVLPVERPNVPPLPGAAAGANDTFQVASAQTAGVTQDPAGSTLAGSPNASAIAQPLNQVDGATLVPNAPYPAPAINDVTRQQLAQALPAGPARPATVVSGGGQTNQQTVDLLAGVANEAVVSRSNAQPSAPATAQTTASADNAAAYVQLSSQRTPEAANTTLTTMTSRFGNLFGGNKAFVKSFDLGDRGTFYRVLVPASSLASANQICDSVKNAGGDCFVRNP